MTSPLTLVPDIDLPDGEAVALVEFDKAVVWLHGDIDVTMTSELQSLLADLQHLRLPVVLDGSHVTFCDSAGIGFVLRLMGCGLPVTLRDPSPALRLLLDALVMAADNQFFRAEPATRSHEER